MAGGVGTSSKVTGPVQYPGWGEFARHVAWHFRGSFLAALVCVFVVSADWGLPGLVAKLHASATFQNFLSTNPAMQLLQQKVFASRTDGKNLEDAVVFALVTLGVHSILYFGMNGFFLLCDMTGLLKKYKLPRTPRMKLPTGLLRKTITESVLNQFLISPITALVIYLYLGHFPSMTQQPFVAPTLREALYHLTLASLVNEVLFYAAHRAFHEVPGLYVRFHKQHHQYVGSVGFAAEYAHPLEQLLANQGPTAIYLLLASRHVSLTVWATWLAWRLWETFEAHSGYCFSESPLGQLGLLFGERATFHDWHHSDNRGNYGVYWLDYLFGTMDSYAQLVARGGHPKSGSDKTAIPAGAAANTAKKA